jgi:hypothetical protein
MNRNGILEKAALEPITPPWTTMLERASASARPYLLPLARWAGPRNIDPEMMTSHFMHLFIEHERGRGRVLSSAQYNATVNQWNRTRTTCSGLPALQPERTRIDDRRDKNARYHPALLHEIEALIAMKYPGAGTAIPVRNRLLDAADTLYSEGITVDTFAALKDPDVLRSFVQSAKYPQIDVASSRRNRALGDVRAVMKLVLCDDDGVAKIDEALQILIKPGLDVTHKTLQAISVFDDPEKELDLIAEALDSGNDFAANPNADTMAPAQAGIAIMMVLQLGSKRHELLTCAFTGPPRHNAKVRRPTLMATVNGVEENLDLLLDDETISLVDQFWLSECTRRRSRKCRLEGTPEHLFQKPDGERKDGPALTISVNKLSKKAIGVSLSPQSLRDCLVATVIEQTRNDEDYRIKDAFGYNWTSNFRFRYRLVRQRISSKRIGQADPESPR